LKPPFWFLNFKKTKTEGGERHPDGYFKNRRRQGLSTLKDCRNKEDSSGLISRKTKYFGNKKTAICLLQIAVFRVI